MTILDTIVARKKEEIDALKSRSSFVQLESSPFFETTCHSFRDAILAKGKNGIIAEFKRKSPSKGIINGFADVKETTASYVAAGASVLSVLTDKDFFGGSNDDLLAARMVNKCPILRKDFIIDEFQLLEAKSLGADVILLIAAILTPSEIKKLAQAAKSLGLYVLLEVHNKEELLRSTNQYIDAVGVNNRNLATFTVDVQTSFELAELIPNEFLKISESAISDPGIISELREVGYNGFLIGENFMKTDEPGMACYEFIQSIRPPKQKRFNLIPTSILFSLN